MALQEHDLIMAVKKVSGKTVKKSIFPRWLDKTAWTGEVSPMVSIKSGSVYRLRSNSSLILDRPKGRILSTLGARSFYAAAPTLWNSLPANIRDITSLNIFKEKLKTYLFNLAYNK